MPFNKEEWTIPTPYGCLGWITFPFVFFATIFFMISSFKCFLTTSKTDTYNVYVGYWSREVPEISAEFNGENDRNYCVAWNEETRELLFDGIWRFGRGVGMLGSLISLPMVCICLWILCFRIRPGIFGWMMCGCIFMSIDALLLIVGLASTICKYEENCKMGPGMYIAIVDSVLWLICACLMSKLKNVEFEDPEEDYPDEQYDEPAQIEQPNYPALPASENYPPPSRKKKSKPANNFPALPPSTSPNVEKEVEDEENPDGTVTRTTTITTYEPDQSGGKKVKKKDKVKRKIQK